MDRRVYEKYIIRIAEDGSLTKAAATLGISQPALSSGLTMLEKELGFKVFMRRNVPITFTPEGEIYYDYIRRLQVLSEDFQQRLDSYRENADREATIGGPVAYVESMVTNAVIALRRAHPEYRVKIRCSPLSGLIEQASNGKLDCFICTSGDIPENFEKRLLKQERVYLCIPRTYAVNEGMSEYCDRVSESERFFEFSRLDGQRFVFLEDAQPFQQQMMAFFEEHGIRAQNGVVVNQVSTALNLALKGEGICFASEEALAGNLDLSSVCVYPLPSSVSGRSIYIAYDRELFMSSACKGLIDQLIINETD